MKDYYFTVAKQGYGEYKEKGSRFIGYASPVTDELDVERTLQTLRSQYYDARHVCYAYWISDRQYRANDDGEPNHSAGDPILGQIKSAGLERVLIAVVRYFGGTKLGVPGLIQAYKTAARLALDSAQVQKKYIRSVFQIRFPYDQTSTIQQLIHVFDPEILDQDFKEDCVFNLAIRQSRQRELSEALEKIDRVQYQLQKEEGPINPGR